MGKDKDPMISLLCRIENREQQMKSQLTAMHNIRVVIRDKGGWDRMERVEGVKYVEMERGLDIGGEHTAPSTDEALQNCTQSLQNVSNQCHPNKRSNI